MKSRYKEREYRSNNNKHINMYVDHELKMIFSHREIRVLLIHEFRLGHKVTEATDNVYSTMDKDILSICTV